MAERSETNLTGLPCTIRGGKTYSHYGIIRQPKVGIRLSLPLLVDRDSAGALLSLCAIRTSAALVVLGLWRREAGPHDSNLRIST